MQTHASIAQCVSQSEQNVK